MSDDIDRAQCEVDRMVNEAQRVRKPSGPVANGRCHYCGELLDDEARWCNAEHRDAWERLRKTGR